MRRVLPAWCAGFFAASTVAQPVAWRMPGHDAARTSQSQVNGPLRGAAFKWVQDIFQLNLDTSSILIYGSNLYSMGEFNNIVYAFNSSSGSLTRTYAYKTCSGLPTIGDGGVLFYLSSGPAFGCGGQVWGNPDFFAAVDTESGELLWSISNSTLATSSFVLHLGATAIEEKIFLTRYNTADYSPTGYILLQICVIDNDNPSSSPISLLQFSISLSGCYRNDICKRGHFDYQL